MGFIGYIQYFKSSTEERPFVIQVVEPAGSLAPFLHTQDGTVYDRENLTVFETEQEAREDARKRLQHKS